MTGNVLGPLQLSPDRVVVGTHNQRKQWRRVASTQSSWNLANIVPHGSSARERDKVAAAVNRK